MCTCVHERSMGCSGVWHMYTSEGVYVIKADYISIDKAFWCCVQSNVTCT